MAKALKKYGVYGIDVKEILSDRAEREKQREIADGIKERDIAEYLKKRVTEYGGIYRKLSYEGRADAPDYLIMIGGAHFFIETKAPGGKPRPSQVREFTAMFEHGGIATRVVSTLWEVDDFIHMVSVCLNLSPENTSQS